MQQSSTGFHVITRMKFPVTQVSPRTLEYAGYVEDNHDHHAATFHSRSDLVDDLVFSEVDVSKGPKGRRDSIASFLITWGCFVFASGGAYIRMSEDDRKSARDDFKTGEFIITLGFLVLGAFLTMFGNSFVFQSVKLVGMILLGFRGATSSAVSWKASKARSLFILAMTSLSIYLLS